MTPVLLITACVVAISAIIVLVNIKHEIELEREINKTRKRKK